jgi:hypothetical protein
MNFWHLNELFSKIPLIFNVAQLMQCGEGEKLHKELTTIT